MKKLLIIALLINSTISQAQENVGIQFEHGLSWNEIKAKAKKENKPIFIDAFTTWCGPCKYMAANIFPLKAVGDFYNTNFINVKVQLDVTKTDDEEVKKWYTDAQAIGKLYKINAYPTYLYLSPDAELLHRAVGGGSEEMFIDKGKNALNPDKQYYTLKKKYMAGQKDSNFTINLIHASNEAYDTQFAEQLANDYLSSQSNLLTKPNLRLLQQFTKKVSDPGFKIFKNNTKEVDAILGKDASNQVLLQIALNEIVKPNLFVGSPTDNRPPDWDGIREKLQENFAEVADLAILSIKPTYYSKYKKDWPKFSAAVSEYLQKYSNRVSSDQLNSYAWAIFTACEDTNCIRLALEWSKKSLEAKPQSIMYLDTYANLLYKSGNKEEAIKVQEEAVRLSGEKEDGELTGVLNKMKSGEKTW